MIHQTIDVEITTYRPANNIITEHSKKKNILLNNLSKKSEDNFQKTLQNKTTLKPNRVNQNGRERVIKVPVRLVGGPDDEWFFLQIPEKKLNSSNINSILKIEVLNASHYNSNDENKISNSEEFEITNQSIIPETTTFLTEEITTQRDLDNYPTNFPNFLVNRSHEKNFPLNKNKKFVAITINEGLLADYKIKPEKMQNLTRNIPNFDKGQIESAIYYVQNSLSNNKKQSLLNRESKNENPTSNKDKDSFQRKNRQRVLIDRGSARHQATNDAPPRRWAAQKNVRKVNRQRPSSNFDQSESTPRDDKVDDFTEVSFLNDRR